MKSSRQTGVRVACVVVATVALISGPQLAFGETGLAGDALVIQLSSGELSSEFVVPASELTWNPTNSTFTWGTSSAFDMVDAETDTVIASVRNASVVYRQGSALVLNFQIQAGSEDVEVVIDTAQLYFPLLSEDVAKGRALASVTLSDTGGGGAELIALGTPGSPIFIAQLNGTPPAGSPFIGLIGTVTIGSGGTGSGSQSDPPSGMREVGEAVESMCGRAQFLLTGGDRVSSMLLFDVDPNPAGYADDTDGDGVPDWADGCPDDPDRVTYGSCEPAPEGEESEGGDPAGEDPAEEIEPGAPEDETLPPDDGDDVDGADDDTDAADESETGPADGSDLDGGPGPASANDNSTPQNTNALVATGDSGDADSGEELSPAEAINSLEDAEEQLLGTSAGCGAGVLGMVPLTLLTLGGYRRLGRVRPRSY